MMLRIKDLREKKDLSIYRLSKETGISNSMIKAYEDGTSEPTASKLLAISTALEVSINQLFDLDKVGQVSEGTSDYNARNYFFNKSITEETDLSYYKNTDNSNGRISLPSVHCDFWIPSTNIQLTPNIRAGSILGLNYVKENYLLDPDLLYYVVTQSGPMIKSARLEPLKNAIILTNHLGKDYSVSLDQVIHIFHLAHFIS